LWVSANCKKEARRREVEAVGEAVGEPRRWERRIFIQGTSFICVVSGFKSNITRGVILVSYYYYYYYPCPDVGCFLAVFVHGVSSILSIHARIYSGLHMFCISAFTILIFNNTSDVGYK
jgi:hypothetical protein